MQGKLPGHKGNKKSDFFFFLEELFFPLSSLRLSLRNERAQEHHRAPIPAMQSAINASSNSWFYLVRTRVADYIAYFL